MKRKAYKFLIITAAMALGLVGCSTEAKVERQLELGASSMEAGDYDAAITAYEEAIALDKYEIEGYEGLVVAMVSDGRSNEEIAGVVAGVTDAITELKASEEGLSEEDKAAAERFYTLASDAIAGDMDMEIAIMEEGVGVLGEESQIADAYEDKVNEVIDHYLAGNNLEEAKELAGQMATTLPSNENAQDTAATVTEKAEAEQDLVDILMIAYEYIQNEDWAALAEFSDSEELAIIKEKVGDAGNYSYIFGGGTTGVGIGYYSMEGCPCDEWYVGDYVDGMRSGYGGWYWAYCKEEGYSYEIYEGDWANDAPNGHGHVYDSDGGIFADDEVTVINGLYDGTYTRVYEYEGILYSGTYEVVEGVPVDQDVPDWIEKEDGWVYASLVYYELVDGREAVNWVLVPEGHLCGVAHFRN
ncbi:MAG: hypothetical protein J6A73_03475 [Lachnospiraceae bacterium]|nr:hypothetical protein [Lachnospiraceae bacterium]